MGNAKSQNEMIFVQLFEQESSTYSYLLGDAETREAVLIDPVIETVDRDLKLIDEMGLKLKFVLDTHVHADHITGAGEIRKRTGAKTVVAESAGLECVDMPAKEGDVYSFGKHQIKVLETPGHTDGCLSYLVGDKVFTGDALLVRGTGRTDFQQGSSEKLYDSITKKLFSLPDETLVYPGHDYRGLTVTTIGLEKKYNPRIGGGRTKTEFVQILAELKLAQPKKIHEAVPANLQCGMKKKSGLVFTPQKVMGIPEISAKDLFAHQKDVIAIDIRRPEEWVGEYGHIEGVELIEMGPDLEKHLEKLDKSKEIVFICRSGSRSGNITSAAIRAGFQNPINLQGGMIAWNMAGLPVVRTGK